MSDTPVEQPEGGEGASLRPSIDPAVPTGWGPPPPTPVAPGALRRGRVGRVALAVIGVLGIGAGTAFAVS